MRCITENPGFADCCFSKIIMIIYCTIFDCKWYCIFSVNLTRFSNFIEYRYRIHNISCTAISLAHEVQIAYTAYLQLVRMCDGYEYSGGWNQDREGEKKNRINYSILQLYSLYPNTIISCYPLLTFNFLLEKGTRADTQASPVPVQETGPVPQKKKKSRSELAELVYE